MPLPQHLRYAQGGTVSLYLSALPTAVTMRLRDGYGTTKQDWTAATISTVNTTLAAAMNAGATSMTVAANTGLEYGITPWIQDVPEDVLVQKVAGATITLGRPCLSDHITGAAVEGGKVTLAVNGSVANSLWWDGHAECNVLTAAGANETHYVAVECTRYGVEAAPSVQDIMDVEPQLSCIWTTETDTTRAREIAMQHVYGRIAKASPDLRTRVFPGSQEFRTATSMAALYIHYAAHLEGGELAETYSRRLDSEIATMLAVVPRDANQDKVISADERASMRTVKVSR